MDLDAALNVLGLSRESCTTTDALMDAYNRKRMQTDFSYDIILRAMNAVQSHLHVHTESTASVEDVRTAACLSGAIKRARSSIQKKQKKRKDRAQRGEPMGGQRNDVERAMRNASRAADRAVVRQHMQTTKGEKTIISKVSVPGLNAAENEFILHGRGYLTAPRLLASILPGNTRIADLFKNPCRWHPDDVPAKMRGTFKTPNAAGEALLQAVKATNAPRRTASARKCFFVGDISAKEAIAVDASIAEHLAS